MKKIFVILCITLFSCSTSYAWLSSDPNDLNIIRGSVWSFQHNNNIDNIGFSYEYVRDSNNVVILAAVNLDNDLLNGTVHYGDHPSGTGFTCMLSNLNNLPVTDVLVYIFNAVGGIASGIYFYYSSLVPDNIQLYSLSGYKVFDLPPDSNQPIQIDQNQIIEVEIDPNEFTKYPYADQNQPTEQAVDDHGSDSNSNSGMGCFIFSIFYNSLCSKSLCPNLRPCS